MADSQIQHYQDKLAYEIDAWDLSVALKNGDKVVVVDARSAEAFQAEHIPDAINLPHRSMTPEVLVGLDRSALYVSYCDGIGCNASTKGALNLALAGLRVKELIGGLDWWKRDGYGTAGSRACAVAGTQQCGCG